MRLITILRGDKWLRNVCALSWRPCCGYSAECRYVCNIFSAHPWILIVQCHTVSFDVLARIERAQMFPHNRIILAFILLVWKEKKRIGSSAVVLHIVNRPARIGDYVCRERVRCRKNGIFIQKKLQDFKPRTKNLCESIFFWLLHTHQSCAAHQRAENNRSTGGTAHVSMHRTF